MRKAFPIILRCLLEFPAQGDAQTWTWWWGGSMGIKMPLLGPLPGGLWAPLPLPARSLSSQTVGGRGPQSVLGHCRSVWRLPLGISRETWLVTPAHRLTSGQGHPGNGMGGGLGVWVGWWLSLLLAPLTSIRLCYHVPFTTLMGASPRQAGPEFLCAQKVSSLTQGFQHILIQHKSDCYIEMYLFALIFHPRILKSETNTEFCEILLAFVRRPNGCLLWH